jgi:hypothetical protein
MNNNEYGATHVAAASAAGGLFGLGLGLLLGRRKKAARAAEPVAALATEPVAEPVATEPVAAEALHSKWKAERSCPEEDFWETVAEEAAIEQAEREGWALFTAAGEAAEKVKISVVLPWRFSRPLDIPRPDVVDARRLAKLPAKDIQFALHRAYMDDLSAAERLHASLRKKAERAVFPLREDAVGALEDIYVLHPDRVMHD